MQIQSLSLAKKVFLASISLSLYFTLVFTGLVAKLDWPIMGAIYELITIPFIVIVFALFSIVVFQLAIKKKVNLYNIASCLVTLSIIVLMFVMP